MWYLCGIWTLEHPHVIIRSFFACRQMGRENRNPTEALSTLCHHQILNNTMMKSEQEEEPSIRIQLFPYHDAHQFAPGFKFITIDKVCKPNTLLKIGRKVDKKDIGELASYDTPSIPKSIDALSFKSKVVSRAHAELFIANDGTVSFRDVGSSSGSFLNRLRLSASSKKSPFQTLKSGDIIQLGVDYQSRQEGLGKPNPCRGL